MACLFETAERFIGLSTCMIQCRWWSEFQVACGFQRSRELFDSSPRCIEGLRLFSGTPRIFQGFLPGSCLKGVMRQQIKILLDPLAADDLNPADQVTMQQAPVRPGERLISHIAYE